MASVPSAALTNPGAWARSANDSDEGGDGSNRRSRRNRIHPKNWGYSNHLDRVFSLKCFEDFVRLRVFPDAKDISESYGALQAALRDGVGNGSSKSAKVAEKQAGVVMISIGDGATPRTATLAAFLTRWHTVSVDPMMRPEWRSTAAGQEGRARGVNRLSAFAAKFEDFMVNAAALDRIRAAAAVDASASRSFGSSGSSHSSSHSSSSSSGGGGGSGSDNGSGGASPTKRAKRQEESFPEGGPEFLVAFAKSRRSEWVEWLGGGGSPHGILGDRGTPLLDPRRYPVAALAAFKEATAAAPPLPPLPPPLPPPVAAPWVGGGCGGFDPTSSPSAVTHLVLVCVHAHHRFQGPAAVERVRAAFGFPPTCVVALPCCHRFNPTNDIGRPPDSDKEDLAIFSACRRILIWRWPAGPAA